MLHIHFCIYLSYWRQQMVQFMIDYLPEYDLGIYIG